jgi:hypothetical protein
MTKYSHIHNAWVICTQEDFSEKTDVQVLVPVGHKGYPGFEIRDAKIKGPICWGHGNKSAMNKEILKNIMNELERLKSSLERELNNHDP